MANVSGTTGIDAFNGGGGMGNTTPGNDRLIINNTNQIQAADTFQGSDGTDTINVGNGFNSGATIDLNGAGNNGTAGFLNFEALTFANTGSGSHTVSVTFSSAQFGTGKISDALAVSGTTGNNAIQTIAVNVVSGTAFTAAGWTFTNWRFNGTNDTITLNGSTGNETITGSSQADSISGNDGSDILAGGSGNDTILGGNGGDAISGQAGNDSINGGAGNDSVWGGAGTDVLDGGTDTDTLTYRTFAAALTVDVTAGTATDSVKTDNFSNFESYVLGAGADTFTGSANAETVSGFKGNDVINLLGGNDTFIYVAGDGVDTVDGGADTDTVVIVGGAPFGISLATFAGWTNFEAIDGSQVVGGSQLGGSQAADTINLSAYTLTDFAINGNAGNDTITGSATSDNRIIGGAGADVLTGGAGSDVFVYTATSHSLLAVSDTITNFDSNDLIDLSAIDANTTLLSPGDDAFAWIGVDVAFTAAGQLRFNSATHAVQGDVNGDGKVDFQIILTGYTPDASDFAL